MWQLGKFVTKCGKGITECGSSFYYKVRQVYYRMGQLLQSAAESITKCGSYYKVRQLLHNAAVHEVAKPTKLRPRVNKSTPRNYKFRLA